jgi:hypothetical protein
MSLTLLTALELEEHALSAVLRHVKYICSTAFLLCSAIFAVDATPLVYEQICVVTDKLNTVSGHSFLLHFHMIMNFQTSLVLLLVPETWTQSELV